MMLFLLGLLLCQEGDRLVATVPDGVRAMDPSFSSDGKSVVYEAWRAEQHWVVSGEWKTKPSRSPFIALLLPNGKDVFYAAFGRPAVFHLNDTVLFEVPDPTGWWFPGVITPDAKTVLNFKRDARAGTSAVAINGKLQISHKGTMSVPVMSPDGKRFAFALENDDGHCIVDNDKPGPTFDWVTQPALSADGKVLAYGAEAEDKFFILHGDRKIPVAGPLKGVFLSPDGASVGWWGQAKKEGPKSGERVVVAGREGPVFATLHPPVFSPDGKHVTYRAAREDKTWCVVVDDRTIDVTNLQGDPVFTADGKHVGFGYRKGQELRWKTLDVR
jgi:hypothetical protein